MQTGGYDFNSTPMVAGQLADVGPHRIDTFSADGDVFFGAGLVRGYGTEKARVADALYGDFLGVAVASHTQSQGFNPSLSPSSVPRDYQDSDAVSTCREGRVVVPVATTVAAGALAYLIRSGDNAGKFTNSNSGTIGPVGRFETAGNSLVWLDVIREISAPE